MDSVRNLSLGSTRCSVGRRGEEREKTNRLSFLFHNGGHMASGWCNFLTSGGIIEYGPPLSHNGAGVYNNWFG